MRWATVWKAAIAGWMKSVATHSYGLLMILFEESIYRMNIPRIASLSNMNPNI